MKALTSPVKIPSGIPIVCSSHLTPFSSSKGRTTAIAQHLFPNPTGWQAPPHSSRLSSIFSPLEVLPALHSGSLSPYLYWHLDPTVLQLFLGLFYYIISFIKNGVYLTFLSLSTHLALNNMFDELHRDAHEDLLT